MKPTSESLNRHSVSIAMGMLLMLLVTTPSHAWEHETTRSGERVRWNQYRVPVVLDESLSWIDDIDVVEDIIIRVFDKWVDRANLPIEFTFSRGSCQIHYHPLEDNENCIRVENELRSSAAATTFLTFNEKTGIIRDADIGIRYEHGKWTLSEESDRLDFYTALLHEAGHFLGMAHSDEEEAVMAPHITRRIQKRTLHMDDIDGASTLYEGLDITNEMQCSLHAPGQTTSGYRTVFLMLLGFLYICHRQNRFRQYAKCRTGSDSVLSRRFVFSAKPKTAERS